MIIETNDDRQLEIVHTLDGRMFIAVKDPYGSEETIMLDMEQAAKLQSYLTEAIGEMLCV